MAESRKRFLGRAARNPLPVTRDLQLPPTRRDQPAFREQRKQKLKEYLLIRKTVFPYKQENQISRDQKMITSEDRVQEGKKVVKLKTEVADKENIESTVEKNCIPLKAGEVTSSEIHNSKDNVQAVQLLSTRDDLPAAATKFADAKPVSTASKDTLVRPPIRSLHSSSHGAAKQGLSRPLANVTVRKGMLDKESHRSEPVVSVVKAGSSQAPSRSIASKDAARTDSSNTRLMVKPKDTDQRRYTIAGASVHRSAQLKDTTAERKAQMTEWRTGKGKGLKRPPHSVVTQAEPKGQSENPVGSFWTTMAEEDEQRLFTEKVNKTISECLNLINEGCPKEEILATLNDLIHNIPDAKKLVKYWICLVRIEPITSPIENIISIYEKAILAGAQPIEEMRHIIIDILTTKSQEKVNLGENIEEAHATKEPIQEVNADANVGSGKPGEENEHHGKVEVYEDDQDNKIKDPDLTTPDSKTEAGCIIRYNVSSTPRLQSMKKMQHDKNSTLKELKFLTPVRRSRRIQDKTSRLPAMLKDHDPSVSSLEQLSELGGDAFVCRPNAALCPLFFETDVAEEE
ncbi:cytoskeleton associated protein 2, isoform CRA_a [Mus musculus]|nr:cytoskeleton associated protein 2, isoform CRA_a [Mus musculus]